VTKRIVAKRKDKRESVALKLYTVAYILLAARRSLPLGSIEKLVAILTRSQCRQQGAVGVVIR
jgi:hypothetical protein